MPGKKQKFGVPFVMKGWSPFTAKKKSTKKTAEKKDENLPTFRKGDVTIPQYDKEGNKRYNLVD